jgi:large subunit ribosomal protein L21
MTESETQSTATVGTGPAATEPVTEATETVEAAPEPVAETPAGPTPYAVIETGGKQYRVKVGDQISVEKLDAFPGSDLDLERVLLVGGDGSTRVGTPVVDGVSVTARVDDHYRGEKIIVFKYKAKKRYRRRTGHRQSHTHLTITDITG